jgi:nitroreductase
MAASVYGSIFPALWSFQLALRSRGLGSTLTTVHLFFEQDVAKVLNIPEDVMQVALLPVAYTVGTDFKQAVRPAPESITSFDEWGA